MSDTSLGLNQKITRAEFVTLLLRLLDIEAVDYAGSFKDVRGDEWYAGYLQAAHNSGILDGSDGNAMPNEAVTREQMAKLVCESAGKLSVIFEKTDISGYADYSDVSPWATEYVEKVVSSGIMTGRTHQTFSPADNALRAEAFAVIYRLFEYK